MLDRGRNLVYVPQGGGKTAVSIWVAEQLRREHGEEFRTVVVVPNDQLASQWEQSIRRFTGGTQQHPGTARARWVGGADVVIVRGDRPRRAEQYRHCSVAIVPYVIVKYSQVSIDWAKVRDLEADCYIADEITAIANPASTRSQAIKALPDVPYKFGLSGDPIENGQAIEIFSEMEWIDSTIFGRADLFDRAFVIRASGPRKFITGYRNLPEFWHRLQPALVKIEEDDPRLAEYMPTMRPPREHFLLLDDGAQEVYDKMANDLLHDLSLAAQMSRNFDIEALYAGRDQRANALQGKIASRISTMRMLCDDPQELIDSAERYIETMSTGNGRSKRERLGSAYAAALYESGLLDGLGPRVKVDRVTRMLNRRLRRDETCKIVVFCYFKGVLNSLQQQYPDVSRLFTGDLNARGKEEALAAFRNVPEVRILFSSDAGGYGLDLPEAQYLINVDTPFSAGKAKQRDTRHRRASSEFEEVYVDSFLMEGTIEEFYATKTKMKREAAKGLLSGKVRSDHIAVTAESLSEFLVSRLP